MADLGPLERDGRISQGGGPSERAVLSASAIQWLGELPGHIRPNELATKFPHIANKLAAHWNSPELCRSYFDEVLLDRRGGRQGLPARVAFELAALKDHFDTVVFPTQQTVWDEIASRARY